MHMLIPEEFISKQNTSTIRRVIVVLSVICILEPLSVWLHARSAKSARRRTFSYKDTGFTNSSQPLVVHPLFLHPYNGNETVENITHLNGSEFELMQAAETPVVEFNQSERTATYDRIVIDLNKTFAFWRNGQGLFCDVIRQVTNVTTIGVDKPYHVQNNLPAPLLRVTLDCVDITTNTELGTGNWITAIYDIRMAAALGMVDLEVQCKGGMEKDLNHLISWFMGYYSSATEFQKWPYDQPTPTEKVACNNKYYHLRIDSMAHEMQSDVRKLAVTVLGTKEEMGWTHAMVPKNQRPMVTDVELDEVVIHFRCGDVLGGANRNDFGIIHFSEYGKLIPPTATTLGIVTQPFTMNNFTRKSDFQKVKDCRRVVTALVDYLHGVLPNTTIRIRNDVNEPLAVTYARMTMTKKVFVSYSSFGVFPAVGTFGDGYFQRGNGGVNPWANYIPEKLANVHMMEAPRMGTWQVKKAGLNATLDWLLSTINVTKE